MPTVDGTAAWHTLQTYDPLRHHGACLYYVWLAYKAHGAQSAQSYPTAYSAWQSTAHRHYDQNPPYGKPIWLGRRLRDGNMDGDVFIAGPAPSQHAATDYPRWGQVGLLSIRQRIAQTGREYLGWTDDFLGNTITGPPTPPPPEEDDMTVTYLDRIYAPTTPQQLAEGQTDWLYHSGPPVDGKGSVTVATGPAIATSGVLEVDVDGLLDIRAVVTEYDTAGKPTGKQWLHEWVAISGSGVLPVAESLHTPQRRLRFQATARIGSATIRAARFRGSRLA